MEGIQASGGKMLETIELFDIYRGAQLGVGRKSIAFSLSFRAPDRTLTDAEIAGAMEKILKSCEASFGAKIRA